MAYEMLVGLKINNPLVYQQYREAMTPLLKQFGGSFRYDFWIRETLQSETKNPIDRIFIICFENEDSMKCFFQDPKYLKIKKEFFESSVEATTIISQHST